MIHINLSLYVRQNEVKKLEVRSPDMDPLSILRYKEMKFGLGWKNRSAFFFPMQRKERWERWEKFFPIIIFFIIMQCLLFIEHLVCANGKESACNAGDPGSIPGSGRPPGEENSNPLEYSCLENPMDRRAWRAKVHRAAKSWTQLSD